MTMTKKELLAIPKRKWYETLNGVSGVYVIPSNRKHDSGYACMDFVAEFPDDRPMVRFGGGCDDVSFVGKDFRMDCLYPHGIIHIWRHGTFSITHDLSSIDFIAEEEAERFTFVTTDSSLEEIVRILTQSK